MAKRPKHTTDPERSDARAGQFVLGLIAALLLVDLLLGALPRQVRDTPEGPGPVRALLAALEDHSEVEGRRSWLMIGDSVLVGDTGQAELPDWRERRLIDYMRRELASDADVVFEQTAYSGLLPVDMLAIVEALDAVDADGSVSLLVQLSPRHFSPAYAAQREHSRPWFAELGHAALPAPAGGDSETMGARLAASLSSRFAAIARHTPIYRHRELFADARETLAEPSDIPLRVEGDHKRDRQGEAQRERELRGALEARARLSVHYRDPDLRPESVQVAALTELLARCRASGRRVVFMATPVEDGFFDAQLDARAQGDYLASLDQLIAPDGRAVELLPMDHPLFASAMFWDHVHLRPEGHRLLAINLLSQLGLGLERLPARRELIAREAVDRSLIARIEAGYADGPAWAAKLSQPSGLAISEDGARLVIADTGNHVLRELGGDMRVVSTLAGAPEEAGERDGAGRDARLDSPRSPVFIADTLYFIDGRGTRLRRLDPSGEVSTIHRSRWRSASLRAHAGQLYVLQHRSSGSRILELDPDVQDSEGVELVLAKGRKGDRLVAFDLDPEGDAYLADGSGRLLRVPALGERTRPLVLERGQREGEGLELLFDNGIDASTGGDPSPTAATTPRAVLPQAKDDFFPYSYEKLLLSQVADLRYVERYGGLLIQDLAPQRKRGKYGNPLTERAQLRYFDLEREQIYPWLKPLVAGIGYFYKNDSTEGFASYYHEGSMAVHQASATLFYLERERSRLLRLEDGLLGVAKISHVRYNKLGMSDVLASRAGERATSDLRPHDHLITNERYRELDGPYTCLMIGSSMLAMSDSVGQYSLGRALDERLGLELELRDRKALHTFLRVIPGARIQRQLETLDAFTQAGGRPDVIIFETNASDFLAEDADEAFMVEQLDAMVRKAGAWDSKLIILDTSPYFARNRDGLREVPQRVQRFLALARQREIPVIDVADRMLDAHLEVSPLSSPPMTGIHMSPWAIDALGELTASALSPIIREFLRGRAPAARADARADAGKRRKKQLAAAFELAEAAEIDWGAALPRLPPAAMQSVLVGEQLQVFIDLGQLPAHAGEAMDASELDALVLACIYEHSVRQRDGARGATVQIGRFGRYDEYGAGVLEGAAIVHAEQIDRARLERLIADFDATP
ncbi:hypothetical protein G6O69_00390 [Pseudenhygromyxa sp. WMMC2535]|uniref:hypothetical protein n=1 Tax=Pseudenhygromyxa sp. WMMC2535 TaxID=2712867 RepID=UPI001558273A|nr:hypothetical protein [Pseudenhygromyxa sp. WMMC2535]NVB36268.1 hypothetical protein [Pseudenhygromyxa sp. WMMC2535]